jgi:hypothetical protein
VLATDERLATDVADAVAVADEHGADERDVAALAQLLYAHWYTNGSTLPSDGGAVRPAWNLPDAYRAADAATGRWEDGWTVEKVSNRGRVLLARDDDRRLLDRIDVVDRAHPFLPPRPGTTVAARARRDVTTPDGSWWMTSGPGWDPDGVGGPERCVRVYWNAAPRTVFGLIRAVTATFAGLPFGFKAMARPEGFARSDTAVLYLDGDDLGAVAPLVGQVHAVVGASLRSTTPRLALALAPGMAVVEDPGTGESFGEHRCRLVAAAIHEARRTGATTDVAAVARHLAAAGVDPGAPHRRADSELELPCLRP